MSESEELRGDILESLEHFEQALLAYEEAFAQHNADATRVHVLFRYAHSIKGTLLIAELENEAKLLHALESNLDALRNGSGSPSSILIDQCLKGVSLLHEALEGRDVNQELLSLEEALLETLRNVTCATSGTKDSPKISFSPEEEAQLKALKPSSPFLYKIDKLITTPISVDDFKALPIFEDITEYGTLITFQPQYSQIPTAAGEQVLELIFVSEKSADELELCVFDPFRALTWPETVSSAEPLGADIDKAHLVPPRIRETPTRILIVEDDFVSRKLLLRYLAKVSDVDVATNGKEALEVCYIAWTSGMPYDVVLLDIRLPDGDGWSVLEQIRHWETQYKIYGSTAACVIMTSGLEDGPSVMRSFKDGADGYLIKPVAKSELITLLDKLRPLTFGKSLEVNSTPHEQVEE